MEKQALQQCLKSSRQTLPHHAQCHIVSHRHKLPPLHVASRRAERLTRRQRLQARAAAAPAVERARPAAADKSSESEEYDVVVVGAGISGLTTAQACLTEHSDTVKR